MTCESEDRMLPKNGGVDSLSAEEASGEEKSTGGGPLKKGPWTSAEDAILVDYVNKHGEGNWNAVQKHSGLARCGKSCRLRWANHLRPDLKKGAFTPEEEQLIIELHAKMGNKWARMAAELPGRTDNEIKNFWNTRIKRRLRAGLPIYPPDICQALNQNQQSECQKMVTFPVGDMHHPDPLPTNGFEIPAVEFKSLELNQHLYSPALFDISASEFLDIPASSLLAQGLSSPRSCNSLMFSALHPPKRLRESELELAGITNSIPVGFPSFEQYQDGGCEKGSESFGFSAAYDHDDVSPTHLLSSSVLSGSHALLNGNSSSSEPISWAMKLELPSLQYSDTQVRSWETPYSLPESVCTLTQSPPTEQIESNSLSRRNSGLLEAVLYESDTLKNSKSSPCHQTSSVSIVAGDVVGSSSQNFPDTEWEINSDPISPLGYSAASVFNEHTPASGSYFDETHIVETLPGCNVKQEALDRSMTTSDVPPGDSNQMKLSRPDFLLASNWFSHNSKRHMEHSILTEAIGALLGEDFSSSEFNEQIGIESYSSDQKGSGESCACNNIFTAAALSGNH